MYSYYSIFTESMRFMKIQSKKIIYLVILILSFTSIGVFASDFQYRIDSLKRVIPSVKNDTVLIETYIEIGRLYQNVDTDSAFIYLKKSLDYSLKTNNLIGSAKANYYLATYYYTDEKFDNSLKYFLSSLEIFLTLKDSLYISSIYTNIGVIYLYGNDRQVALDYQIKALEINTNLKRSRGIGSNLNNIGQIYQELNNYEKAIEYYNKTLEIGLESESDQFILTSYLNIGALYLDQDLFEKAYENFNKAYKRMNDYEDADFKIEILSNLGEYYLDTNQPDSAITYIQKSLNIAFDENRKRTLTYSYFLVGRYFIVLKNYRLSITHFLEAIKLSETLNMTEKVDLYYKYLSDVYSEINDYKNAHIYLQKSIAIKNSIQTDQLIMSLGEYEKQKEFDKIQAEFKLEQIKKESKLENEAIRLKWQFYISIIIIVFLVVLVIIFITTYRNKTKANKQLTSQNEIIEHQSEELKVTIDQLQKSEKELEYLNKTKDKFFSIIAHDLKNPFNILIGYSDLLLNETDLKKQPEEFNKIVQSMNRTAEHSYSLLENLLAWARSQSGGLTVNFEKFNMAELINSNIEYYKEIASSKGINLFFKVEKQLHVLADKNMLNVILRNLIDNAVKFTVKDDRIDIISKMVDDKIKVSVCDSGKGISLEDQKKLFLIDSDFKTKGTANESGTGLGLLLCKEFVNKNNGEIFVESEEGKGSIFTISLPIA